MEIRLIQGKRAAIARTPRPAYIRGMTDTVQRRSDCPTNYGLEHFGDRWTLLIVREMLYFGKTHYGDFLLGEEGISTNILATRLKKMQADGLITSGHDADARRVRYALTDKGIDLVRIMVEINRWSGKYDPDTGMPAAYAARIEREFDTVVAEYRATAQAARRR